MHTERVSVVGSSRDRRSRKRPGPQAEPAEVSINRVRPHQTHSIVMQDDLEALKTVDLGVVLAKARKEENVPDQPLYVDEAEETIKCRWCTSFKGSQELKHINQHTKKAVSHQLALRKTTGVADQGDQPDIRTFFT